MRIGGRGRERAADMESREKEARNPADHNNSLLKNPTSKGTHPYTNLKILDMFVKSMAL